MRTQLSAFSFGCGVIGAGLVAHAAALGTSFTYQGQLGDSSGPASGTYDFRFTLFDAATGGAVSGSAVTTNGVTVSNGLFIASLDFGSSPFSVGQARWLQIEVRTNGVASFTTLAPRQSLSATPYALYAPNSGTAATASRVAAGGVSSGALADSAVNSAKILDGAVATADLADNAVSAVKLASDATSLVKVTGGAMSTTDGNVVLTTRQHLNDHDLHFRSDLNHGLGWYGSGKLFAGANVNGPALFGNSGGVLGVRSGGTDTTALAWDNSGVSVAGQVRISGGNPGAGKVLVSDATGLASWQTPSGQGSVPSGGMILSSNASDANLQSAGFLKLGRVEMADSWEPRATPTSLAGRSEHTVIWTGSEMLVWGGYYSGNPGYRCQNDGGRFRASSNLWTAITTAGAPVARFDHTAVWSGTEMIVWGGWDGTNRFNSGGRYNPATGTWTSLSTAGAPSARNSHTAVWTGTEMIVWGGADGTTNYLYTGARYNPTANTWASLPTNGAPSGRYGHAAVWTGAEMIIWGGGFAGGFWTSELNTGGRYNPTANTWTAVTTSGAPLGRSEHTAVWTGTEMIVWGGRGTDGSHWGPMNSGGRYNPAGNSWAGVTTEAAPTARADHTVVWTGAEMIVWGGDQVGVCNDGGVYRPSANSWRPLTMFGAPGKRELHTAVWTGGEMIIWGGDDYNGYLNDTYSYTPPRVLYLYQKP